MMPRRRVDPAALAVKRGPEGIPPKKSQHGNREIMGISRLGLAKRGRSVYAMPQIEASKSCERLGCFAVHSWRRSLERRPHLQREFMGNKLFVGGLSWNTNDEGLRQAFEKFGAIDEAKVISDRETGRSRGFGFVTFRDSDGARKAIQEMDGKELDGRNIKVNEAEEKPRGSRGGGGGGGGGRW
jgi:hypothetical protein